jgi:ribosomal-protein-alanine N-acetyltransferase
MGPEDIAQVMDIERQSFPTMWPQTTYQRELKNKAARYFVACEPADLESEPEVARPGFGGMVRRLLGGPEPTRDRILGMVGLWCVVGEGHIVTIAVRQNSRRQGLGEILLMVALEAAMEAGQQEVTLEYRISNHSARAMYEKYGFREVGVRARYYSDNNEDAVLMTTPPLRSPQYQRLLRERNAAQREQRGSDYPLAGQLGVIERTAG